MIRTLILIALLAVGCNKAANTEQTTPTPGVEPAPSAEVPGEANRYAGSLEFLLDLVDTNAADFERLCAQVGGNFTVNEEFITCTSGNAGFAIHVVDGVTIGSSILVPTEEGQELASALVDAVGEPDFVSGTNAVWELPGFALVFGPVGNVAWITVLERTE